MPELEPTTLPVSAAPAAALQVASRWARAWVRPPDGTTSAKWLDGLRTTTTDEYLGVLAGVDPANIPATKVTGAAKAVSVSPRSLRVQVPTDALTLADHRRGHRHRLARLRVRPGVTGVSMLRPLRILLPFVAIGVALLVFLSVAFVAFSGRRRHGRRAVRRRSGRATRA